MNYHYLNKNNDFREQLHQTCLLTQEVIHRDVFRHCRYSSLIITNALFLKNEQKSS